MKKILFFFLLLITCGGQENESIVNQESSDDTVQESTTSIIEDTTTTSTQKTTTTIQKTSTTIQDSTTTLIIRSMRKNNLFTAHSDHFYQKMIRKGYSHQYVLKKILFLLIFLVLLSFISLKYYIISFSLAFISTILSLIYFSVMSKNE